MIKNLLFGGLLAASSMLASAQTPDNLYLIGMLNDLSWAADQGELMENAGNGIFTVNATADAGDTFGFATTLGSNANDWATLNSNRYGTTVDGTILTIGQVSPLEKAEGAFRIQYPGEYKLTADMTNMTVLLEAVNVDIDYPETLYMIGHVTEDLAFDPSFTGIALPNDGNNTYTAENVTIYDSGAGFGYFAFTSTPGADPEDWPTCNAHRYGPRVTDTEIVPGLKSEIGMFGDVSYKVTAGIYDITIDLGQSTILLEADEAAIADIDAARAAVIGGDGRITISGQAGSISIVGLTGQTVATGSSARTFDVPAGIYIVIVDGKASKVAVR